MIDLAGLETIEFHDAPVGRIDYNEEPLGNIEIEIFQWNEEVNDYIIILLVFGELSRVMPQSISCKENDELEVYSFDYYVEDELFYGEFTFLHGIGEHSSTLELVCKSVVIEFK
ncbi:hypothetical protein LVD15_14100 [Fulvivirga maritima]|uniref:hypothetical protein n=1 Tax=Fulvivirga maritima TaxID=2904247 RepID=UPI001F1ACA30|nr:hypothetical protein [Fulvivirga maritima]UII24455.1 hypothetical protein LVD15_14100 [Fulvivirga maritima]